MNERSATPQSEMDCCGGKCLMRCYPIGRVMFCPRPVTQQDIDAAKEAFIRHTEKKEVA